MAETNFVAGYWYKCLETKRPGSWNPLGAMDFMLDGRPRQCTGVSGYQSFKRLPGDPENTTWNWYGRFELVDPVVNSTTTTSTQITLPGAVILPLGTTDQIRRDLFERL